MEGLTQSESMIIHGAVSTALEFGLGLVTEARKALEEAGFTWSEKYEDYIFAEYVQGAK